MGVLLLFVLSVGAALGGLGLARDGDRTGAMVLYLIATILFRIHRGRYYTGFRPEPRTKRVATYSPAGGCGPSQPATTMG